MRTNPDNLYTSSGFFASVFLPALASFAVLVSAGGCSAGRGKTADARESAAPEMVEAKGLQKARQYDEAASKYRDILQKDPLNAMAHFELAVLLMDTRFEEVGAIYHFREYIEARPDSDKRRTAEEFIERCERKLVKRYGAIMGDAASAAPAAEQMLLRLEEVNRRLNEANRVIARLQDENKRLQKENDLRVEEVGRLKARIDMLAGGPSSGAAAKPAATPLTLGTPGGDSQASKRPGEGMVATGSGAGSGRAVTPGGGTVLVTTGQSSAPSGASPSGGSAARPMRTHRVMRGDTLWSIAQLVYGDGSRSGDIRRANPTKVGPKDMLTEGDVLNIPY